MIMPRARPAVRSIPKRTANNKGSERRAFLCNALDYFRENGAGEGIRTLDPNLGKVSVIVFLLFPKFPTYIILV